MEQYISKTFLSRISGFSPFAIFVELENGIEGTLYLSREKRYTPYEKDGTLRDTSNKIIATLGESLSVKVIEVDNQKKRIVVERN
jgi:exoribonuclease R